MRKLAAASVAVAAALVASSPAGAQVRNLEFDLTKVDGSAYTTNVPAAAFTAEGLRLSVKAGDRHEVMSKGTFTGEYSFDLQIEVLKRSEGGSYDGVCVDMLLLNAEAKRKVVARYVVHWPKARADRASVAYYKDGKPMSTPHGNGVAKASSMTGLRGTIDWLRLHLADKKVFFIQKAKEHPYRWPGRANYPKTTYFDEDCETFRVGLAVYPMGKGRGEVLIKRMRLTGPNATPRDARRRTFLFDFGPVDQELEDDFCPVSEYTMYARSKGYGWVIPEWEKVVRRVPGLSDEAIVAGGYPPVPRDRAGWYQSFLRGSYWMQANDKKYFHSVSHGGSYVEFFKRWLDLKTPLQRDLVAMVRPFQFGIDDRFVKDVEERRGSLYIDDDLAGEFVVDLPNGRYNLLIGTGLSGSRLSGGETGKFHLEVEGRVRKKNLSAYWRRTSMHPIRNVEVVDGQMNLRFFCDIRRAMDKYSNHEIGIGWLVNYLLILPAEQKELVNEWEWRIIKRRGEIIRRVTFVEGDPAVTKLEGRKRGRESFSRGNGTEHLEKRESQETTPDPFFLTLNGKPFYYVKLQNNYHPGRTQHFSYYCLHNVLHAYETIRGSQHFFKPDWEKLSYADDYPWRTIDRMNVSYTWGYLNSLHQEGILSFVPRAVSGEGTPTMDSRGRRNRYNIQPPLNSALGKEIQKEAYTMMSNQLREHPALGAQYIYEELWHPNAAGYDDQSLLQYWDWLRRKYGSIDALNAEWGRKFKAFEDILQPRRGKVQFWEHTPEFVNFRKFRAWAQREMVRSACELVRKLEPDHVSWGAKGDYGTQSWHTGEFLDMFGWYSPYVAASVARHFGRAAIRGGYMLNCEYAYLDGRKQFNHKPGKRSYRGRAEVPQVYNKLVSSAFKGTKAIYSEWYSNGMCHVFHPTALIRRDAPKYRIKHWTGQIAFFDPEAFEGPPVNMHRGALYACRANQMLYRLSQLWLPAAPLRPKVLLPVTEESCFLNFFGARPSADFEGVALRALRSCNLPGDFVNMPAVKDLAGYDLIVMTDLTQTITRADAERVRRFVLGGGKLILVNAAGFSDDDRPRRYTGNRDKDKVYPLEAFADLGGYRLVARDWYHPSLGKVAVSFASNDVAPEPAGGPAIGEWSTAYYYRPMPGSKVFLKGVFQKNSRFVKPGTEVALGVLNKTGNVAVVQMPPKGAAEAVVRPIAQWVRRLIGRWGVDGRVTLDGVDDAWDVYAGTLTGDGYTLAAVCNQSKTDRRKLALKLSGLAGGEYAVIDVTGDRPDLRKAKDGGWRLKDDPAARRPRIDHRMTAAQLAETGIPCEVAPTQAQVFLIRPLSRKVWVSIWPPALKSFARKPVTVAYGTAPEDKAGAESLRDALATLGVKVKLSPAGDVKRKKLRHEVRVDPFKASHGPRDDPSKWYLMDVFDNEVVDSTDSILLVGSRRTNPLLKHLSADGAFAYDKVLEKVSAEYPGPGRGVIGWIDAVNAPTYNLRSQARDAVYVGGSDAAGTRAAVARLVELIHAHCRKPAGAGG